MGGDHGPVLNPIIWVSGSSIPDGVGFTRFPPMLGAACARKVGGQSHVINDGIMNFDWSPGRNSLQGGYDVLAYPPGSLERIDVLETPA